MSQPDLIHIRKGSIILITQPGYGDGFAAQFLTDWCLVSERTTADQVGLLVPLRVIHPLQIIDRGSFKVVERAPLPTTGLANYRFRLQRPLVMDVFGEQ